MKKRPIEFLAGGFVLGELVVLAGRSVWWIVCFLCAYVVLKKIIMWKKYRRGKRMASLASFCGENASFCGILKHFWRPILFGLVFMLGMFDMKEALHISERTLWEEEPVTICGIVEFCQERPDGIRVTIRDGVVKQGERQESGNWYLYGDGMEQLAPGHIIVAEGRLSYPQPARNTGEFDYQAYCDAMGIVGQIMVEKISVLLEETSFPAAWFQKIRRMGYTSLAQAHPEDRGMLAAMILGNRNGVEDGEYDRFAEAGTAHLLSISALHLSVVGYSLFRLLSRLGVTPLLRCGIPIGAVWAYTAFSGGSASALRAAVMFSMMMGGQFLGRTYDLRTGMSMAALYLFGKNPLFLTLTGVQYSFSALFGIAFVVPKLQEIFPDAKAKGMLVNLGIFLATLPVQCRYSYEFSPISILVNALMIPGMSLLLISGIGGLFGAAVWPFLGKLLFVPAHLILWIYDRLNRLPGLVPFGRVVTGEPTFFGIFLYIVLCVGILKLAQFKKKSLVLFLLLPLCLFKPPVSHLQIHFLDVGQGDCTVIQCPGGKTILIDGGSTSRSDLYEYTLEPFLKANRIDKLEVAMATHMDQDHISALGSLLEGDIETDLLLLSSRKNVHEKAEGLKEKAGKYYEISQGEGFSFGNLHLTCLAPEKNQDFSDENEYSLVFLLEYRGFRCLFTGDLGEEGEQELLEKNRLKDVDLLKVGHHGSRYSSSKAFLQRVRPELAVISCGKDNRYGHPHEETLLRLAEAGGRFLVTAREGEICVEIDKGGEIHLEDSRGE